MENPDNSEVKEHDDDEMVPCWLYDKTSETCDDETRWSKTNELVYTNKTVVKRVYLLARILKKMS